MIKKMLFVVLCVLTVSMMQAQYEGCSSRPSDSYTYKSATAPRLAPEVLKAFPSAVRVDAEGLYTAVYSEYNELLGYVVYSKPYSNGITGYAGETPLAIILDKDKKIMSVELLANEETHFIVDKVMQSKMLQSWNGLTMKQARKKRVDAVTGATYTSTAIMQSMRAVAKKFK